jgi:DNA-binding NtrC family response regulator
LHQSWAYQNLIGKSQAMRRVREQIRDVSAIQMNVFIEGEIGTGREWVAKAVHYNSPNREQNLVSLHCDAVPETLAESELFGHEKAAFPGADESRIGKLEKANGGSLLLKEVDKMPRPLQNGLLRFMEGNQFQRLGGTKIITSKMRMIATAAGNLKAEVESGSFNEKLFFRLNVYPIHLPPLRERSEDIPLLVQSLLKKHQGLMPKQITSVSSHALEAMMRYKWPGNVRQLENVICRAFVTAREESLQIENLPEEVRMSRPRYISGFSFPESGQPPQKALQTGNVKLGESGESTGLAESAESNEPPSFETIERYAMFQALDRSNGNISKAARELGISRATLYRKVKKYRSL